MVVTLEVNFSWLAHGGDGGNWFGWMLNVDGDKGTPPKKDMSKTTFQRVLQNQDDGNNNCDDKENDDDDELMLLMVGDIRWESELQLVRY